jgi:tetratricopeptide (TPR) repeat protein
LFSGFKIDKDQITVGGLPDGVGLDVDPHRWIPMERLLAVKQSDPEYRAERLAPQFYGESWALVHLLLFDDKSLTRPTVKYLDNLDIGVPEADAFKEAFPFDKNALDQAVHKLIEHRVIHVKRITYLKGVALDDAPISAMTPPQADAELARLSFMLGWSKETPALVMAALKENPSDPAMRALNARVTARGDTPQDISDLAGALAKGGSNEARLRIDVAAALLTRADSREAAEQAFAVLDDLVHGDAPPLEAVALWAAAAEISQVDPAKLLKVVEGGSARAPHNTRMLRDLARAHEMLGDAGRARDYYDRIILVSDRPDERLWAQKQADSVRLQKK